MASRSTSISTSVFSIIWNRKEGEARRQAGRGRHKHREARHSTSRHGTAQHSMAQHGMAYCYSLPGRSRSQGYMACRAIKAEEDLA